MSTTRPPALPTEPHGDDRGVDEIVTGFGSDRGRLMDIVIEVQRRFGYVSDDAVQTIAAALGIHAVEVNETVSFYAFLDRHAAGRNRIRLSKTPVAFMKGARAVADAFEEALG